MLRTLEGPTKSRVQLAVGVSIAAAIAVLAISCGRQSNDIENFRASDVVLVRSLGGQPGSLDPQLAEDAFSFDVLRDLYEGLTASSPSGEVIPAVAESWSTDESGKTYTFHLRKDARWSNGDPVLARHFIAGLRRAVDPATASGGADLLKSIVNAPEILAGRVAPDRLGVSSPGDRTLEIRLSQPVPYFPDILTNTVASPVHDSTQGSAASYSKPGGVVTNGPYVLDEMVPGARLHLKRNVYFREAAPAGFDEVRYEFVADENAEYTRFRAGQLDVTNTVPEQRFEELARDPNSGLQHRATLATFYLTFNTDRGPLHGKPALREALTLAIDREAITRSITRAGQVPAYSLVPPDVWNYEPAAFEWRNLDEHARLARARKLYAQAGHSAARPLHLRLLYNENDLIQKVCVAIAAMWKESLGVDVELVQMEFRAYLAARADPAQWDVVRVGWSADYNDASSFLETMTVGSPQNFGRWSDAQYAELLARAAAETDQEARRSVLQQAERRMLQDYPLLPVYYYVTRRLVGPRVVAPEINPMNRTYSRYFQPREQ